LQSKPMVCAALSLAYPAFRGDAGQIAPAQLAKVDFKTKNRCNLSLRRLNPRPSGALALRFIYPSHLLCF
jgi:hypothetical protein